MPPETDDQPGNAPSDPPQYLTTKEVADLLRVKERKVYDLAAEGDIPHIRATGKLLFPREELTAWMTRSVAGPRPAVLAGSHDPLLDWAVRESGSGLATLFDGSTSGLERYTAREAALCGLHIPEGGDWNIQTVQSRGLKDCTLLAWAERVQGLIVPKGAESSVSGMSELPGKRVMLRQRGAGAYALFEQLAAAAGVEGLTVLEAPARTETDAALAVASGEADVALGLQAVARQFQLGFVPLVTERFDLLIDQRAYFTDPVQKLMEFGKTDAFRAKAQALGGYDITTLGQVRWLAP